MGSEQMDEIPMSAFPNLSGRHPQGAEQRPSEVPAPKIAWGEEGGPVWEKGNVSPGTSTSTWGHFRRLQRSVKLRWTI